MPPFLFVEGMRNRDHQGQKAPDLHWQEFCFKGDFSMPFLNIKKALYVNFGVDRRKSRDPKYKGPERRSSVRRKKAVDRIMTLLEKELQ
jgi:hypothetical protein